MKLTRSLAAAVVLLAATACNQQAGQQPQQEPAVSLVPADFEPCNTITFAAVEQIIGTRPTISADDRTGSLSPGWATCAYSRKDESAGSTMTVRVLQLPSGPQATRRHGEIIADIPAAQAFADDPDGAVVWSDGSSLHLQYHRGWWLVRRTIDGATDTATRERLVASPRWP